MLISYHERIQTLFCEVQPAVTTHEKCHEFAEGDNNPRINHYQEVGSEIEVEERKGVLHLVHAWPQQGHPSSVCNAFSLFLTLIISLHCILQF